MNTLCFVPRTEQNWPVSKKKTRYDEQRISWIEKQKSRFRCWRVCQKDYFQCDGTSLLVVGVFFNSRHWGKKEAKCLPDDHPRSKQAKSTACLRIERNGITIVKVETLARFCSISSWGNFACTRNSELVSVRREHSNRAFESRRIDHGRSFHR